MNCVECDSNPGTEVHGLCPTCVTLYDGDIVREYEEIRFHPDAPISALPKTREKVELMRQRWAAGLTCFHEDDPVPEHKDVKERFIGDGVYARPNSDAEVRYVVRQYHPTEGTIQGGMKPIGIFDTVREARKAADSDRARLDRKKSDAPECGVLSFEADWWQEFQSASRRRDGVFRKFVKAG